MDLSLQGLTVPTVWDLQVGWVLWVCPVSNPDPRVAYSDLWVPCPMVQYLNSWLQQQEDSQTI